MRKSVWLLSAGLFALSVPAQAQQAPETDTDDTAAEATQGATAEAAAVDDSTVQPDVERVGTAIIVTATRRNQALSDVPLAVSAVSAENLEYSGASDIRQLNQLSPSLLVSSTSSESSAAVARIRGVGTVGDNPGLESSVALFVDGVYRSRTAAGLTELGPLDRIEVLRGPQGTLFGRNASAGLISVITAKPLFTPMVAGELTIGNYDLRRVEASVTGPVADGFAARLDAVYLTRDGFLTDVISGRDVNDRDRFLVRMQGLYEPTADLAVRLIADVTRRREECCAAPFLPARNFVASGGGFDTQPSTIAAIERALGGVINDDPFERNVSITPGRDYDSEVDDWGVSGEVVYDFGGAEVTSITAYRVNDVVRGQDSDFNNLDILYRASDGGNATRFDTFTQEARLQGETLGGRLDWLVGAYYADEGLRQVDNLAYGEDYARFANCLVAASFAAATTGALLAPTSPTCFNPLVAQAILPLLPARQQPVLSAFARLGVFGLPIFTDSGFGNLATAFGAPGLSLTGTAIDDRFEQSSRNFALFTHNIFTVAPGLDLTVGVRYTRERKELDATLSDNNSLCTFFAGGPLAALQTLPCVTPSAPGGFEIDDTRTESKFSGTAVVSYKPTPDLLTYASYSRGYKAGGFNLDRSALRRSNGNGAICVTATQFGCGGVAASGADLQFKPETNDAFELGAKYNGRAVDVNVAAFYQMFENFQLNTFNGLNFVVENINSCSDDLGNLDEDNDPATGACAGDTRAGVISKGVEFELFARPLRNVNWNFGAIYADTRYRDDLVGSDGRPLTNALFQLPGRRISNSSEWVATTSLAWTPPIGTSGLRGLVYADARYQSEINTGSDLDLEKIQDDFTVVNGRIGLHGPNELWGIELWAANIFNEEFIQVAFDAPLQGSGTERGVRRGFYPRATQLFGAFLGEPRTYGLTLRTKLAAPRAAPVYVAPPAPPPPAVATQVCPDGSVILATDVCPAAAPPPPAPMAGERG